MSKKEIEKEIKRMMHQLSEAIKTGRKEKGWSIEELSEQCGVSPEVLYELESGESDDDFNVNTIKQIMNVLGYELKVAPLKKFWGN